MTTFKIPVVWLMAGEYFIDAETLEEAEVKAEELPLPEGEFVSFELDKENEEYGKEVNNEQP